MNLNCRFAVISDPHIALTHTIRNHPNRFHLVEVSIPAMEWVLESLQPLDLDFLLLPGDLTQDGEADNHAWLSRRLAQLPYPVYVVPGNHDVPSLQAQDGAIGLADFPHYYHKQGYGNLHQLYYTCELLPGLRLIGLNSNTFDAQGNQIGRLDEAQLNWLESVLAEYSHQLILVMIHHNVVEHLPGQAHNPLGRRYMLENASQLLSLLHTAGVQLIFSGHLHIQDVAAHQGIYDITTGSLVSYPHPYRVLHLRTGDRGDRWLQVESGRIETLPGWQDFQKTSRDRLGSRSLPYMLQLLTYPPVNLSIAEAEVLAPSLHYFWADIAKGDAMFDFPHFPAIARQHFERFGAISSEGYWHLIDNHISLRLTNRTT